MDLVHRHRFHCAQREYSLHRILEPARLSVHGRVQPDLHVCAEVDHLLELDSGRGRVVGVRTELEGESLGHQSLGDGAEHPSVRRRAALRVDPGVHGFQHGLPCGTCRIECGREPRGIEAALRIVHESTDRRGEFRRHGDQPHTQAAPLQIVEEARDRRRVDAERRPVEVPPHLERIPLDHLDHPAVARIVETRPRGDAGVVEMMRAGQGAEAGLPPVQVHEGIRHPHRASVEIVAARPQRRRGLLQPLIGEARTGELPIGEARKIRVVDDGLPVGAQFFR